MKKKYLKFPVFKPLLWHWDHSLYPSIDWIEGKMRVELRGCQSVLWVMLLICDVLGAIQKVPSVDQRISRYSGVSWHRLQSKRSARPDCWHWWVPRRSHCPSTWGMGPSNQDRTSKESPIIWQKVSSYVLGNIQGVPSPEEVAFVKQVGPCFDNCSSLQTFCLKWVSAMPWLRLTWHWRVNARCSDAL